MKVEITREDKILFPKDKFTKGDLITYYQAVASRMLPLNDPSFGPRTVTYKEFDQGYTGIVIHFALTDKFKKGGVRPSVMRDLIGRLKPVKKSIYYIILTGFCLLIPGLSLPIFLRIFIDNILVTNILPWKGEFLLAIALAMLIGGVLTWLQQYYLNRLNTKLSVRFSSDFLWHILRLPISFYYQRYPAEIASRMSLNNQVAKNLTGTLATTLISLFLVVFYGIVMLLYDVTLYDVTMKDKCILLIPRSPKNAHPIHE